MAEFIEKHWDLINWPTALIAVVILTPVAAGLFALIASYSREALKAERDAHNKTKTEKDNLSNEVVSLKEQKNALNSRLEVEDREEQWRDVELTDEEQTILMAISMDQMDLVYRSNEISNQRIALVLDRLRRLDFIGEGTHGHFAYPMGREWLDAKGLLK